MILVDTSSWVEYDRATGSAVDARLSDLIASGGREIGVCEPVLMEVLAGARSDRQAEDLRRLLLSFGWLGVDVAADFEGAARIYRRCRAGGITPGLRCSPPTVTSTTWLRSCRSASNRCKDAASAPPATS